MFSWDDLRVFVTLHRERTTVRAARVLGTSQSTIVRRLAALENDLDLKLFTRGSSGLVPTEAGKRLYPLAIQAERSVCEFTAEVELLTETGLKLIRLTLPDHFEQLVVPVLREFRKRWPAVDVEILPADRIYDLDRGEADIAIRGRTTGQQVDVVARDLPACGFAVYASAHAPESECPDDPEKLALFPIADLDAPAGMLPIYRWLKKQRSPDMRSPHCKNLQALASTIASGAAIGALPCTMGDANRLLRRCFEPNEAFDVPIYLIVRRAALRRPPARDLFDSLQTYFCERPQLLLGKRN
ncbi:LysR family transcriptional regulator [Sphingomonas xanthus]|uniref:LysR family transcriptional regulator n=1 Tax=Sphingomonas xanthus TaxID=2594473 RepID=A0A516IPF5_9SPHN|nr:LysR family transcriptional regulator [Sphingomonas xanthus]QDP18726.1 LysR family transcriptional regulator [Sphingomonas xanthus]